MDECRHTAFAPSVVQPEGWNSAAALGVHRRGWLGGIFPAWIPTSCRSLVKMEHLEQRRKKQPACSLRLWLKEKQITDGYRMCWVLSAAEDELLSCQTEGGSMERLSWALVSCGSDYAIFCTFQNKTKNKVILNTHWIWNAPLFQLNRIILLKIHSKIPFKVGSKEI